MLYYPDFYIKSSFCTLMRQSIALVTFWAKISCQAVTHKETLAIISGIKHHHVYLEQSPCTVVIDHSPLTSLPTNEKDRRQIRQVCPISD